MQRSNFVRQLVMSAILLGIVAGICYLLPRLGNLNAVLAASLLLSLFVAAVNGYWYIVSKTEKSLTYNPKGWIVWLLGRRTMGYAVILVAAFLSSLCFVIHVPSLHWFSFGFIFLTAPVVFAIVYCCVRKILVGESVVWMTTGRTLRSALWITPLLMALLYGLFLHCSGFVPVYDNLEAAIDAQPTPWEGIDSVNFQHVAGWSTTLGGCRDYGIGQLFQANQYISIILVSMGYLALFFNIGSLLAFCFVPLCEYKRLLVPLTPGLELPPISPTQSISLCVILLGLMSLCFALFNRDEGKPFIPDPEPIKIGLIKIDDTLVNENVKTLLTEREKKLRDELDRVLAGPMGKLEGFQGTLTHINDQRAELYNSLTGLKNDTYGELRKLHEEELFPRIERNVDGYLDWYYSITGEYLRAVNLAARNIAPYMERKLNEHLMRNVDFQKAEGLMRRFLEESDRITAQIAAIEKLAEQLLEQAAEASEEVARIEEEYRMRWKQTAEAIIKENEVFPTENMSIVAEYASVDDFLGDFQGISIELASMMGKFEVYANEVRDLLKIFTHHSNEYLSFENRMTIAGAAGITGVGGGTAIGVRVAAKITGKRTFKIAVEAVVKMIAKRTIGVGGGAGAGAVVGAGVGSVVPVIGTGIGAAVGGIAGGVGAWVATDYVAIKLEEHISRASFKREILYGVNEQRAEMIRALENIFQANSDTATPTQTTESDE